MSSIIFRLNKNFNSSLTNFKNLSRIRTFKMDQQSINEIYERCKKNAAYQAVDENININCVVGVGSGSTVTYVIERLAQRCKDKNLILKCIPTSVKTKQLLQEHGLALTNLDDDPVIDVAIDGADELDSDFVAIKGGGACATREKIVASVAKKFIVVADYRKNSQNLGDNWRKGIPIDVIPLAVNVVRHKISEIFNVPIDNIPIRKNPKTEQPVSTDDGNIVIDWIFQAKDLENLSSDWCSIAKRLKLITGVVETGLFTDMVKVAYFGNADGSVEKREIV